MLLILSADPVVGQLVAQQLAAHGLQHHLVDVSAERRDRDSYFELAYETGATAVLLIEPLSRPSDGPMSGEQALGPGANHSLDELVRGALAAAGAPMAHGLGWVTSRSADDPEIDRLRRLGVPYGVLRVPAVFELHVSDSLSKGRGSTVLVEADATQALRGTCSVDELAEKVAALVAAEGHLEGRVETLEPDEAPLEAALARRGLEPIPLAPWRVGLNAFFGSPVVTIEPDRATVTVARRPFGRRPDAATAEGTADGGLGPGQPPPDPILRPQAA